MLLIRDIMYCKPGRVRPLVETFLAMNRLAEKVGMPRMRVMTDVCAERYWTLVSEMEVESMEAYEKMMQAPGASEADMREMDRIMSGYHEYVESGRREIYRIEG